MYLLTVFRILLYCLHPNNCGVNLMYNVVITMHNGSKFTIGYWTNRSDAVPMAKESHPGHKSYRAVKVK